MNESINRKLARIRTFCEQEKGSAKVVRLNTGAHSIVLPVPGAAQYYEFLTVSNGARFGIIDLFNTAMLADRQSSPRSHGGSYCIGQVLYAPLEIRSDSGIVNLPALTLERSGGTYPDFDQFMDECALGPQYAELCRRPEDDGWFRAMKSLGLI